MAAGSRSPRDRQQQARGLVERYFGPGLRPHPSPPSLRSPVLARGLGATEHRAGGPGARAGETPFQRKSHKMPSLGPSLAPLSSDSDNVRLGFSAAPPRPVCVRTCSPSDAQSPASSVSHSRRWQWQWQSERQAVHLWGSFHSLQAFRLRGWQVLKHLGLPLRIRKQTTQKGTS